jgi:hypothetical protein
MDERHRQQEAARDDMSEAKRDEARAEAWLEDAMWREEEAETETETETEAGGFPPWMRPWGKRRRPPNNNYPYDPYDPPPRRHHYREREYTSGWWIVFWVFLAIIILALLTPSVGSGVSVIGSSFTAVLGLVILSLAVWKVVDLIRYR